MKTYLLAWNPKLWDWNNLAEMSANVKYGKNIFDRWGVGILKKIGRGDKFFLIRLGQEPKGIFASGQIESNVFEDLHWDTEKLSVGKTANYVTIKYDVLLNPKTDAILPRGILQQPPFSKMNWDTRMSGVQIPDSVASELEMIWKDLVNSNESKRA